MFISCESGKHCGHIICTTEKKVIIIFTIYDGLLRNHIAIYANIGRTQASPRRKALFFSP